MLHQHHLLLLLLLLLLGLKLPPVMQQGSGQLPVPRYCCYHP
jgi:hypothetical protein